MDFSETNLQLKGLTMIGGGTVNLTNGGGGLEKSGAIDALGMSLFLLGIVRD
jgi:hypothetical protein